MSRRFASGPHRPLSGVRLLAAHRHRRGHRSGATSAPSSPTSSGVLRPRLPLSITPRSSADSSRAAGRRAAMRGLRDRRRDRNPPPAPGGVRELAPRVLVFFLSTMFALVGGVVAAFIDGGTISLGSLARILRGLRHRRAQRHPDRQSLPAPRAGGGRVGRPRARPAGNRRPATPILMSAGAIGLALLPLVVLGGIPGLEIVHPMAVVILGGLVTSTLFSLVIVPALYLLFGPKTRPEPFQRVVGQPAAGS